MLRFASPEWIAALDEALRVVPVEPATGAAGELRVRYRFTAADGAVASGYDLVLGPAVRAMVPAALDDGDGASAEPDDATVTITQSLATAQQVALGAVAAQQALLAGEVRVAGRVLDLPAWRPVLEAVDAQLGALRAATCWD